MQNLKKLTTEQLEKTIKEEKVSAFVSASLGIALCIYAFVSGHGVRLITSTGSVFLMWRGLKHQLMIDSILEEVCRRIER